MINRLSPRNTNFFAFCAGAVFPLALAPFSIWPLGILSLFVLFTLIQSKNLNLYTLFFRIWWFGFGQFIVGVSWVYVSFYEFGELSVFLSTLLTLLFTAFLGLIPAVSLAFYQHKIGRHITQNWLEPFGFAVVWWLQEWLRSHLFTGFPWLFSGDTQLNTWLNGFAPVLSVYGLSFLTALTAASFYHCYKHSKKWLIFIIILWLVGFSLQTVDWTRPIKNVSITALQGNVSIDEKWNINNQQKWIDLYLDHSTQHWSSDLIVWPETAITRIYQPDSHFMTEIGQTFTKNQTSLLTGIPFQYNQGPLTGRFHNSLLALGEAQGLYHKQKLVPLTEYIPLISILGPMLTFFNVPIEGFLHGKPLQTQPTFVVDQTTYRVAPFICFDIAYPLLVAKEVRDAHLLVEISNDAWFNKTIAPEQHVAITQMRALETARPVVRVANTGISAFIDYKGNIINQLEMNQKGSITHQIMLRQGSTPVMLWGIWPLLILSAAVFFVLMRNRRRNRYQMC